MKKLALLLVTLASACSGGGGGGNNGGGGFGDDGGSGTGTLKVTMNISTDRDPADVNDPFEAVLAVSKNPGNTAVAGATVTLHVPGSDIAMTEDTPGLGVYSLSSGLHMYPSQGFRLDIDHVDGSITGASIAAPDLTQLTQPLNQANIGLNEDALVLWNGRGAQEYRLEFLIGVSLYDTGWVTGDPGTATIPAAVLQTSGTGSLTLRRRKELSIPTTTALPGSIWTINIRNDVLEIGVN